jgi:hypothetical protein
MTAANLYVLAQRLGKAAITQATKTAQLAEQRQQSSISDITMEREARKQLDQLLRASIAYTGRFIVVCNLGTVDKVRELEEKLVTSLKGIGVSSTDFQHAIEDLAVSALTYATVMAALVMDCATLGSNPTKLGKSMPAREQMHRLSRAAIAFTMQLTIACSADQDAAGAMANELEALLIARLDEVPWYEDSHD